MEAILARQSKNLSGIVSFVIRRFKSLLENGRGCQKYMKKKKYRRLTNNKCLNINKIKNSYNVTKIKYFSKFRRLQVNLTKFWDNVKIK